MEDKYEMNS